MTAFPHPSKPVFTGAAEAAGPVPGGAGLRRRAALLGGAAGLLLGAPGLDAQPLSVAAEEARAGPLPALGSALTVPRIERLDGSTFEPASAHGQAMLVYWWSSTCPFCALQSPSMERLWRAQRGRGWQMLALSVDRQPEAARAYLRAKGYGFPAAWASPAWRASYPKPKGLPITLLWGSAGRLLLAERGQMFDEDVAALADLA